MDGHSGVHPFFISSIFANMVAQLSGAFLTELAHEFGTPLYVYHAEKIKAQYPRLLGSFSRSNVRCFYACKALTNISVLRYIREIGCNIDCSSINEVLLALKAGFIPE